MGTTSHPSLLAPLAIGGRSARNRVVFGPHETNLGQRRTISQRHVAYYRRRAAGGAGVLIVEEASVHDSDWPYERAPIAEDAAPGWADVATACHDEGALVLAALGHAGGQGTSHWSQRELWAPVAGARGQLARGAEVDGRRGHRGGHRRLRARRATGGRRRLRRGRPERRAVLPDPPVPVRAHQPAR